MSRRRNDPGGGKAVSLCEIPSERRNVPARASRVCRHRGDFSWRGTKAERYKIVQGGWAQVSRTVLLGNRGEKARFSVRYFEIAPGGYSSLEKHAHEHFVLVVRGRGLVRVGKKREALSFMDCLYIGPNVPHQLTNPYDEPFGFFCVVDAQRDRPILLGSARA